MENKFVFKDRWSLPSKIIGLLCCHKAKKELLTKEASFNFKIKKALGQCTSTARDANNSRMSFSTCTVSEHSRHMGRTRRCETL